MLKKIGLMLLICLAFAFPAVAQVEVADITITSGIDKQMPVDRVEVHPADYGKLYCFTRIVGAEGETSVTHVWFYQDNEMARVELPVGSADWRTYSSKRFLPQWVGQWRVIVFAADGTQLNSISFVLQ